MKSLSSKEVVLGVTGSIAAYKACELASLLVKQNVRVTPVLTKSAQHLVGPATFEAITGHRAILDMFEPIQNPEIEHISVAARANLFLIAPATANILAKAAHGIADDWLSTTLLATRAPVLYAPAMNTNMYEHAATQANLDTLRERGAHFVGPVEGRLACGTEGIGKMAEPQTVLEAALPLIDERCDLAGKHVVLTTGGTREPIDPVRYIGNRSSGKMGRALAMEALRRKARVTVVSGPSEVQPPWGAAVVNVETAHEMEAAVQALLPEMDIFIGAAAVADYGVPNPLTGKHKRGSGPWTLELAENSDIIAGVGAQKRAGQVIVGFAAETDQLLENAQAKLATKSLDLVLANQVGTPESGFGTETLKASIIGTTGPVSDLGTLPKEEVARRLLNAVIPLVQKSS